MCKLCLFTEIILCVKHKKLRKCETTRINMRTNLILCQESLYEIIFLT